MNIKGVEGLTYNQLKEEVEQGGEFVVFQYTISILILTFKRPSSIYFIRAGEGSLLKSLPFTLISLLFGWWGIPWGPIYTIGSLIRNLSGGKKVTAEMMAHYAQVYHAVEEAAVAE